MRWFARSGLLEHDDVREMLGWENSGFSIDATVRIAGSDRTGPVRRLRYCARPPLPFELERIEEAPARSGAQQIVYHLPKPRPDSHEEPSATTAPTAAVPKRRSPARYRWAMLLARLFESMPLTCPNCGADMRIDAFIIGNSPQANICAELNGVRVSGFTWPMVLNKARLATDLRVERVLAFDMLACHQRDNRYD